MRGHARSVREWAARKLAGRTKVKSSIYYASSSIVCQVLRFVGIIVSTRLIGANEFGLFARASLALSFTLLTRDVGQNYALVSYSGTDPRYGTFNFQINLVLGTLASLALLAVLELCPGIPVSLRQAAGLMMAITFCETMVFTVAVLAQREFRFRLVAVGEISAVSLYLLTLVALIHRMEGFLVLLCAQLIESLVRLLVVGTGLRWQFVGWADGKDLRDYYFRRNARMWIAQNLLQTLCSRMDVILLSTLAGTAVLGVYDRVSQFVRIPMSLSINLLDRVLAASYSREQNSPAALRATLGKAQGLILLAAVSVAAATTSGMFLVLGWLVGASWAGTILHVWWVAVPFSIVVPLVWNHTILLQSTGNPKGLVLFTLATATGELVLGSAALLLGFGVRGMFVARTAVWVGVFFLQTAYVRRLFARSTGQSPLASETAIQRTNSNMPQA